ncbi:hypothetical protein ACIBCR_14785 [Micromonospora echinospora]|uniref:hypothetical protein n=1 Tax=Micromonospora echinospora TaxID=1877 RepID=UPI0037BDD654
MTVTAAPPAPTFYGVEEVDGRRFYFIGDRKLLSCTTITGTIAKPALMRYAAKKAAEGAFAELPSVVIASRVKPCGNTGNRCAHEPTERCERCPCTECKACMTSWLADRHIENTARRSDEGTRVHDVIEWWALHGEYKPYDQDIAPYIKAFQAFTVEYGITPESFIASEVLVVNYDAGYAGTCDGILLIDASKTDAAAKLVSRLLARSGRRVTWKKAKRLGLKVLLVIDFKTREGEGPEFYPEQALQVTGYRHAPILRVKNSDAVDAEQPMPATDGGMLIQLRPDGFTPRLVMSCDDTYRDGFLYALGLCKWLIEYGAAAVSSHTFVLPETLAARERKAAREAAEAAANAQPIPAAA